MENAQCMARKKWRKDALKPEESSWTMPFTWQASCHCSSRPSVLDCTLAVLSSFRVSCQENCSLLWKSKRCKVKWDPSGSEEDWARSVSSSGDGCPFCFSLSDHESFLTSFCGCDCTVLRGLLCCYPWFTVLLEERAAVLFSCVQSSSVYKANG